MSLCCQRPGRWRGPWVCRSAAGGGGSLLCGDGGTGGALCQVPRARLPWAQHTQPLGATRRGAAATPACAFLHHLPPPSVGPLLPQAFLRPCGSQSRWTRQTTGFQQNFWEVCSLWKTVNIEPVGDMAAGLGWADLRPDWPQCPARRTPGPQPAESAGWGPRQLPAGQDMEGGSQTLGRGRDSEHQAGAVVQAGRPSDTDRREGREGRRDGGRSQKGEGPAP